MVDVSWRVFCDRLASPAGLLPACMHVIITCMYM